MITIQAVPDYRIDELPELEIVHMKDFPDCEEADDVITLFTDDDR